MKNPTDADDEMSMDVETDGDTVVNDYYDFREYHLKDRNVALFEITKPFTDLPYTLVLRDFDHTGYLPLFSGFYIEMSWGVSPKDDEYLRFLWKKLGMEGECDLVRQSVNEIGEITEREGLEMLSC